MFKRIFSKKSKKVKFVYPNPKNYCYNCPYCDKTGKLPANFCGECGKELADHIKAGVR